MRGGWPEEGTSTSAMRASGERWHFRRITPIAAASRAFLFSTCGYSPTWPMCCGTRDRRQEGRGGMILCDDSERGHGSERVQPAAAADRRRRIARQIPGLEVLIAGSLRARRRRCGKEGCRCARGELRGPCLPVTAGWRPDPDALRSGRACRRGAPGGGGQRRGPGCRRDLGDQPGAAVARAAQLKRDACLRPRAGDAGGQHARGRRAGGRERR